MEAPLKRKHDACVDGSKAMANNSATLGTDLPLQTLKTTLDNAIISLDDMETHRIHNLSFTAKQKKDLQTMRGEGWAVAKIVEEFAKATNNSTLEHLVGFHKSDFSHGSYDAQKNVATIVFNATTPAVVTAMTGAGYNITPGRVAGLGTAISDFAADQGLARADIANVAAYGNAERDLIKNVLMPTRRSILNLMASRAATQKIVYDTVLDAFEILNMGKREIADRVRVYDSVLNLRLEGALVQVQEIPTMEKRLSSELGIVDFSHELLDQGNYTLIISLHGYGKVTITNVPAVDTKMTIVDVPLVKNGPDVTVNYPVVPLVDGHPVVN